MHGAPVGNAGMLQPGLHLGMGVGAPGMLQPVGMPAMQCAGPTLVQTPGAGPSLVAALAPTAVAPVAAATVGAPMQQVLLSQFNQTMMAPQLIQQLQLQQPIPPPGLQPTAMQPNTLQPNTLQPNTLQPSTLQPAMQPNALMPAQFQMHPVAQQTHPQTIAFEQASQAYEQLQNATPEPEVTELAHHFKLDERITKDLDIQMKRRKNTLEDDLKALWEILEGARNPAGLLRVKIREMEEGTFRGTATPDRDVEDLAKKFSLDAQASAKLAEVLSKREDRKKDLRQVEKHLELSNKPSSLVMLMLKDLRAGIAVKDPEYPAAVGSYAHKRGMKRGSGGSRRSRSRSRGRRRRRSSESSSSPPSEFLRRQAQKAAGADQGGSSGSGPAAEVSAGAGPRPMTLLERFG